MQWSRRRAETAICVRGRGDQRAQKLLKRVVEDRDLIGGAVCAAISVASITIRSLAREFPRAPVLSRAAPRSKEARRGRLLVEKKFHTPRQASERLSFGVDVGGIPIVWIAVSIRDGSYEWISRA